MIMARNLNKFEDEVVVIGKKKKKVMSRIIIAVPIAGVPVIYSARPQGEIKM